ncbi:MAG: DUF169 domain-containing protein [Candidatus Aenigmatarchaeota archaeon]
MTKYENLEKRYDDLIKGKGVPIGVKLLENKEEVGNKVMFPDKDLGLCQVLKEVAVYEKTRGVSMENMGGCVIGSRVLGFEEIPDDLKERWVNGFGYTEERFEELMEKTETLPVGDYEAAVMAPLREFDDLGMHPDSVVMVTDSSQVYLLLLGVFDKTGQKTSPRVNGHAACEVIVPVAEEGVPWLTVPCGGARSIAGSQDDELWIGLTTKDLEKALDRVEETDLAYPPAVNQMLVSEPNPDHPLTGLISREG